MSKSINNLRPSPLFLYAIANIFGSGSTPTVFGDGEFNDGLPIHAGLKRRHQLLLYAHSQIRYGPQRSGWIECHSRPLPTIPSPTSVGFPLVSGTKRRRPYALDHYGRFSMDFHLRPVLCRYPICPHAVNYSSAFSWTKGQHTLKAGGSPAIVL